MQDIDSIKEKVMAMSKEEIAAVFSFRGESFLGKIKVELSKEYTQVYFSKITGIHDRTVAAFFQNRTTPTFSTIIKISKAYLDPKINPLPPYHYGRKDVRKIK